MSSPQPRPMATPDLAGLLAKRPLRSTKPSVVAPAIAAPNVAGAEPGESAASGHVVQAPSGGSSRIGDQLAEPEQYTAAVPVWPREERQVPALAAAAPEAGGPRRQYKSPKQVYLPRSLHQRCLVVATERATTMTALILQAVNATHRRLGDILQSDSDTAGSGDLFDIPQAAVTEPSVQTTMRLTDQQLRVLNELARQHGTKRSRLLSAALRVYLDEV